MNPMNDLFERIGSIQADDVLAQFGLEKRRSNAGRIASTVGLFGTGALVGAGLGLLFAPKTGREMRERIMQRGQELGERGVQTLQGSADSAEAKVSAAKNGNGRHVQARR